MRNIKSLLTTGLLCSATIIQAQQVTDPANNTPVLINQTPVTPAAYPGLTDFPAEYKFNYIRSIVPDAPVNAININTGVLGRQSTAYFDGLGRPLQTVQKRAHADGNDIINTHVYDAMGRESYRYQPYLYPSAVSDGNLSLTPKTSLEQFYNPADGEYPFGKTEYEKSPTGRVTKQLSPGKGWVGANRGITYEYRGNLADEGIRIFTVGNLRTDIPISSRVYAANELEVTKVIDEDGKYTLEYKNKVGQVVLRKKYLSGTALTHEGFACTYYVYDDLQRLRYVIPPEALVQRTETSRYWTVSATVAGGLCFKYFYDNRGRIIEKKIPGKAAELYVYDNKDRLAFYQDGNLSPAKWDFYIYDALDRQICFGTYESSTTQLALQNFFSDGIAYTAPNLLYYQKNYGLINTYPSAITNAFILGYNYYDNYNELVAFNFDAGQFAGIVLPSDGTISSSVKTQVTTGLSTGNKIRIMDPANPAAVNWLATTNFYDDNGRLIQTQSQNHKGGLDISSNLYYFQGTLWKNILRHQNPATLPVPGTNTGAMNDITVTKTYERNIAIGGGNDLVYSVTQKIGNGPEYPLADYQYDHLTRMKAKQTPAGFTVQKYNTRGLLNQIRVTDPLVGGTGMTHIFEENLYYDEGFGSKLYNGNIAGITWKKAGNAAALEAYGYSYDNLNRLNHAEYRRQNSDITGWNKDVYDYSASGITYDLNGNIKTMNQRGLDLTVSANPVNMDQLTYIYAAGTNQLVKVNDGVPVAATPTLPDFKDKANLATEYSYDLNGNLIADANKQISAITYDRNNKPEKIEVQNQGSITYIHDAAGNLLQKKVHTNATNIDEVYDYVANFVYKDNLLQYILNEEGRARPQAGANQEVAFVYDYFVKDHLGNVRSTVTAEPVDQNYLATHEIAMANIEQLFFDNIPNVRDSKPGSINSNDAMAARLNGSVQNKRVGTAIMLKTMPGDRFNVSTDAHFDGNYAQNNTSSSAAVVESLLSTLLGGNTYSGVPLSELPENIRVIKQTLENPALAGQLDNLMNAGNNLDAPRAHLNVLFFDDKMQLVPGNSSVIQVNSSSSTGWTTIAPGEQLAAPGSGYVLIYIDNQSVDKDVWFDNVTVGHYRGRVNDENHYYPFGLTLQTAEASNVTANPYRLTTKQLEKSFDLNIYDFGARMQDMQNGRWFGIDPLAEKYYGYSPYSFCINNPVKYLDPNGKEIWIDYGNDERLRYEDGKLYGQDGSEYGGKVKGFLKHSLNALNKIATSKTGKELLDALSASKNVFDIKHVSENSKNRDEFVATDIKKAYREVFEKNPVAMDAFAKKGKDITGGSGGTVYWDPRGVDLNTTAGIQSSAETDLAHELAHGYDANRGLYNDEKVDGLDLTEYNASYRENLIRGELQRPLRVSYGFRDANGDPAQAQLLDSKLNPIMPKGYQP